MTQKPPIPNNCSVVYGYMPPVQGALAGHDMRLSSGKAAQIVRDAQTAAECAMICTLMQGRTVSNGVGAISARYCFSFDWSQSTKTCLIGTSTVSRHQNGERGHGVLDSSATTFCYYERLWRVPINSLTGYAARRNPLIGRLVQINGIVTSTSVDRFPVKRKSEQFYRPGFFLQQQGVPWECKDPTAAIFVHTRRFAPRVGSVVQVTAVPFVYGFYGVELSNLIMRVGLTTSISLPLQTIPPVQLTVAEVARQRCEGLLVTITGVCMQRALKIKMNDVWVIQDSTGVANVLVHRDPLLFVDGVPGGLAKQQIAALQIGTQYRVTGVVVMVGNQIYIQTSSKQSVPVG